VLDLARGSADCLQGAHPFVGAGKQSFESRPTARLCLGAPLGLERQSRPRGAKSLSALRPGRITLRGAFPGIALASDWVRGLPRRLAGPTHTQGPPKGSGEILLPTRQPRVLRRASNDRLLNLAVAAARAALWDEPGALGHELVVVVHLRTPFALRRVLNKTSLPFQNPPKFKQIQVKFFQVVARKESH